MSDVMKSIASGYLEWKNSKDCHNKKKVSSFKEGNP